MSVGPWLVLGGDVNLSEGDLSPEGVGFETGVVSFVSNVGAVPGGTMIDTNGMMCSDLLETGVPESFVVTSLTLFLLAVPGDAVAGLISVV